MRLLRRLSLVAVTSLFRLTLFFGVSLMALLILIGTPHQIENSLTKTGAYKEFVPAVIQSVSSQNQGTTTIPLNDPGVQAIILAAFPPQVIQNSAETIINGSYSWLNGKTPQLAFQVDLTKNRELLAENLSSYAFNRLTAKPLCTTEPRTINPFTAECLPRNFNLSLERTQFASQISNLLPKTVFTANDLPRLSGGRTIAHGFPEAPTIFRIFKLSPFILGGLLIVLPIATILLCHSFRKGFKTLASITLSSGIALVVTPLLYELVYPHISNSLSLQSTNTGVNVLVENLIESMSHNFYDLLIKGSLIVINLGLVLVLAERLTRAKAYENIEQRAGVASSNAAILKDITDTGLSPEMVPLQSSETVQKASSTKKARTYRKIKGREL
jgi:hypothetical protein